MTFAAALIAARSLHILALSILFGVAVFPFYGLPPGSDPARHAPWLRPLAISAAVLTAASGAAWWVVERGDPVFWCTRVALAVALASWLLCRDAPRRRDLVALGAGLLLASLAWTGHAGEDDTEAAFIHRILDAFHLLAAGVWLGALAAFAMAALTAARRQDGMRLLQFALERFARVGTAAVATLTLGGILNRGFLASFGSPYGQVLLIKLALFSGMLLLAAANRYWLTPRLSAALGGTGDSRGLLRALQASLIAETSLGIAVIVLVGWLGTLPLPPLN